jgi:hypothetical protein
MNYLDEAETYTATLAKFFQKLKKDAGAESVCQNYKGVGTQRMRPSALGTLQERRLYRPLAKREAPAFRWRGLQPAARWNGCPDIWKKAIPYSDAAPEVIYQQAMALLKAWATPRETPSVEALEAYAAEHMKPEPANRDLPPDADPEDPAFADFTAE